MKDTFRPLSEFERIVLNKLFEADFAGHKELQVQLHNATVKEIDDNGSLYFNIDAMNTTSEKSSLVVEARYCELEAGSLTDICVNVLLHIKFGKLHMLEIYKDDGSALLKPLAPDKFVLFAR